MNPNYLDFEQPIAELQAQIDELRHVSEHNSAVDLSEDIRRLEKKNEELTKKIFGDLGAWQVSQMARHPQRPYTLDYIEQIFTDFDELAGDRAYADDKAIVGGIARLDGEPVMVIGQQKGRETKEKIRRNFGMPHPEGYRKARRMYELANQFRIPILTFVDTPGAYPGIGAEERGQSEAIGACLASMARAEVPIVTTIIGEGGSGGALALAVASKDLSLRRPREVFALVVGCVLGSLALGQVGQRLDELQQAGVFGVAYLFPVHRNLLRQLGALLLGQDRAHGVTCASIAARKCSP